MEAVRKDVFAKLGQAAENVGEVDVANALAYELTAIEKNDGSAGPGFWVGSDKVLAGPAA